LRRRRLKRYLAVSTIVANMLMVLITLSLAAILVAWAGTSFGAFSGGSQLFFAQRGQAIQERFVIEQVYFNTTASPDQIFVFVRNVGPININITAIYVNGTSACTSGTCATNVVTLVSDPGGDKEGWDSFKGPNANPGCSAARTSLGMAVGAVCEFSLTWPNTACLPNHCPWVSDNIFQIVVASIRGNQVAYSARAP
jgi:FlaG/FlaF family flagellin (archaellin)